MTRRWVEVLVVVAIVGVCIGLFLPTIPKHWDGSANRYRCTNNLRQIGIAMHNYYDVHRSVAFPSGTISNEDLLPEKRLSWLVDLLPFLEQEPRYKVIDTKRSWDALENQQAVNSPIRYLLCPSNSTASSPNTPGLTHYVGIAGIGVDAATLPVGDPKVGFFGYDRKIKFKDIKDGTSRTVLATETTSANGPWAAGGPPTVRGLDPSRQPYIGQNCQFSEIRRSGCNAVFGDASVRFINESIKPQIFEALATIAGGETVSDDDF